MLVRVKRNLIRDRFFEVNRNRVCKGRLRLVIPDAVFQEFDLISIDDGLREILPTKQEQNIVRLHVFFESTVILSRELCGDVF